MNRKPKYKPASFTTTLRNPERIKSFLSVLKKYNNKVLDNNLIEKICKDILRKGLYKPKRISPDVKKKIKERKQLSDIEVSKILKDNPQEHGEAGFEWGWPSRFDTWFKISKELGFVFYKYGKKIKFSSLGLSLAAIYEEQNSQTVADSISEESIFLNSFVKYQRNNPFRKVLNENAPFILLLQVIKILNSSNTGGAGISKSELLLLIYWKDNNAEALSSRIKKLREEHGFSPSEEVLCDICINEIMKGKVIKRDRKSIIKDYPDDFIRKMRLTGLISLRGGGRFIDINKNEQKKVNYILNKYSKYKKYDSEKDYFKYISEIDNNLISLSAKEISSNKKEEALKKWVDHYPWIKIRSELKSLSRRSYSTKDDILKYLPSYVKLEFLIALGIKSRFPDIKVIPHYPIDDEGLPTSTASGNRGDIECFEQEKGLLIEVTMLEGGQQTKAEVWPIARHLSEFKEKIGDAICYFIAPSIFSDSIRQINFLKPSENLFIYPKKIEDFIKILDEKTNLTPSGQ